MPTLYILCGLPFSGKSTLARQIAGATDSVLVSYDTLWQETHRETDISLSFDELCTLAEDQLAQALKQGSSAVYDTLNNSKGWRDRLRQIAVHQGARSVILYLNTPLAIIEERRTRNQVTGERHSVGSETLWEEIAKFEIPDPSEAAIEFTPETDVASWLKQWKSVSIEQN
jgi:predicted kinase